MMSIKRKILLVALMIVGNVAYGQSDIFLTQQWFSRINMNPAATGNNNHVDVFLLNRQQWVGFENAPKTSVLNAHSYFNSIQSGLGMSLLYDKIGIGRQTVNAMFSYAYHIDMSENTLFSMGLSGGLNNSNWNPRKNHLSQENDPQLEHITNIFSRTSADFNAGVELNIHGITWGASITHLLNTKPYTGKPGRECYVYTRYRKIIDHSFDILPGIIYRYGNKNHFLDFNVTCFYQKKYWAGLSFRPNNAFSMMLGIEYNMFRIGYAYDHSIGTISSFDANSHEIMLFVRIQKPQKERKTTRFLD